MSLEFSEKIRELVSSVAISFECDVVLDSKRVDEAAHFDRSIDSRVQVSGVETKTTHGRRCALHT